MAIEWFSSEAKSGAASFYSTNITLNTIASVPLESAYRIQVGLDESKNVVIQPVSKERMRDGDLNGYAIYQISIKKTYARISSTDLMKKISKALGVILDDKPVKYGTTWDVKESILIVHTGK